MAQQYLTNNERIEVTILRNLIFNEDYTRKTFAFILMKSILQKEKKRFYSKRLIIFVRSIRNLPTKESLLIELGYRKDINEDEHKIVKELITSLNPEEVEQQWLLDTTEKFCKDRAVHNAVLDGIKILDGKDKKRTQEAIPSILADALAVSFDNHIGHDYIEDAEARFKYYHTKEKKYQFDLSYFNRITKGGVK